MDKILDRIKMFFKKNIKMKALVLFVIINILYVFVSSYLATVKVIEFKQMAKGFIPLLIANVTVSIAICIKGFYKRNIIHLFMVLIIIFGIISTIFAIKPKVALWGIGGRYEGLFTIMYYFSLMFLCGFIGKKYRKIIIWTILITGIIQCIYALCQKYEVEGVYRMIHTSKKIKFMADGFKINRTVWATGFTTNPNFFATYMLLCASFAMGLYIDGKKIITSVISIACTVLFIVGLLISNTSSCIVGMGAVCIFSIIYCLKNKYIKKMIFMTLAIVCTILVMSKTGKTWFIKDTKEMGNQAKKITSGEVKEGYGTDRIYIWKNTLKIVPNNLIHGVGIDNFYYAFGEKPLVTKDGRTYFDKVHNEYLQILVTEGIFCLAAYLSMYVVIGARGLKNCFKNKEIYLIIPVLGYLVQAFFNISVIEVAPIFFVALGLCGSVFNEKLFKKNS